MKTMFNEERRLYSAILLSTMVLTLVIAFTLSGIIRTFLLLICVIAQYGSLLWYLVLLIPGGKKICCACIKCLKEQATDN